jgi:hypothetical protein
MKLFCLAIIAALFFVGCSEKNENSGANANKSSSGNPLDAPGDYLRAVGKAQQTAVKTVDTASLNQAIQLFNVEKGRNPKDLDELVQQKFIPQIPAPPVGYKLSYDASSGKVSVIKQ